jgi:hypothetical protein
MPRTYPKILLEFHQIAELAQLARNAGLARDGYSRDDQNNFLKMMQAEQDYTEKLVKENTVQRAGETFLEGNPHWLPEDCKIVWTVQKKGRRFLPLDLSRRYLVWHVAPCCGCRAMAIMDPADQYRYAGCQPCIKAWEEDMEAESRPHVEYTTSCRKCGSSDVNRCWCYGDPY